MENHGNKSRTERDMKDGNNDAIAKLGAVFDPLAEKAEAALAAIAAMDDSEVWTALYTVERKLPLKPDDRAFSEAESVVIRALRDEHASRLAKGSTWLAVSVQDGDDGRFCLRVYHDAGEVLCRDFGTSAEAWAAGEAVLALLELEGRSANARNPLSGQIEDFFHETPRPSPADDDESPF